MVNSMTGFAALQFDAPAGDDGTGSGRAATQRRAWEIRSVNGRGLDIRLRLPEGHESLDPALRKDISARIARGNVSLTLRIQRQAGAIPAALDATALAQAIEALRQAEAAAESAGLVLAQSSAAEILSMRGVWEARADAGGEEIDARSLRREWTQLLDAFAAARAEEGAALAGVIAEQLDRIEGLTGQAAQRAASRADRQAAQLRANLARVLENSDGADPDRVAQELALLAVKSDVTEEIDRLRAHVSQARGLLGQDGPVGRKLDFLTQEFNREANTLCSKAQDAELTQIGLELKTVIDQMREQVQNVE